MRKNSKKKGNRFERVVCKFWEDWTGYEFQRVPQSGGLRWKNTSDITSDVICTDKKHSRRFPFSIECKSHQDIRFEHSLLQLKTAKINDFWAQTKSDAKRGNKLPILFMKYNGMPKDEMFVGISFKSAYPLTLTSKKPYSIINNFGEDKESIVIMMASDILENSDYLDFYKHNKQLLKEN